MIETVKCLSRFDVRHLLISGQATVLYGAAEFSEDIDLWVSPDQENLNRLLAALGHLDARVGQLTPLVTEAHARFGHAFHFAVTEPDGQLWPLDVLGQPPRVDDFESAFAAAVTPLRSLPEMKTIDPMRLVALKKTDREKDYPIIARLVHLTVEGWLRHGSPTAEQVRWVCSEARSVEPLWRLRDVPGFQQVLHACDRPCLSTLAEALRHAAPPSEDALDRFQAALDEEKRQLQRESRLYWPPIIEQLKEFRRQGKLLPEGRPVREL